MKYRDPSGLAPEKEKHKDEVMDLTPAQLHFAIVRSFELAYAIMHEPTLVSWINHMRTSEYDIMVMGKEYCPDTSIYGMVRTAANGVEYVYDDFYGWVRRDAAGRSGSSGGADNGAQLGMRMSKNPNTGEIITEYFLGVTTSDGQNVWMPINFVDNSISSSYSQYLAASAIVQAANMTLGADPTYFDGLAGGDYSINIASGAYIAEGYNSRNPDAKPASILPGLHTHNGENAATFWYASEFFTKSKAERTRDGFNYLYKNSINIFGLNIGLRSLSRPWQFWEAFAHEIGHHLDLRQIGLDAFRSLNYTQRENMVIDRVNRLRSFYNMKNRAYIK